MNLEADMSARFVADPRSAEHVRTLVLGKIRRSLHAVVSPEFRDAVNVSAVFDAASEQIAANVVYDLYGREVSETVVDSERVPQTWLDAVKERFCDNDFFRRWKWLADRTQPRYRTINTVVKRYHMCPHVRIPYDTRGGNVHIAYLAGDAKPSS